MNSAENQCARQTYRLDVRDRLPVRWAYARRVAGWSWPALAAVLRGAIDIRFQTLPVRRKRDGVHSNGIRPARITRPSSTGPAVIGDTKKPRRRNTTDRTEDAGFTRLVCTPVHRGRTVHTFPQQSLLTGTLDRLKNSSNAGETRIPSTREPTDGGRLPTDPIHRITGDDLVFF